MYNKQQAKELMLQGVAMTHRDFADDEFITMPNNMLVIDENGYKLDAVEFWTLRESESFNEGWSKYGETITEYLDSIEEPLGDNEPFVLHNYYPNERRVGRLKNTVPVRTEPKIGRNELCPCGSGKKYKKCCINKDLGSI